MKAQQREKLIRWIEIKLREWDPIKVISNTTTPDSEYDSYAPTIADLLIRRVNTKRLAEHLNNLETVAMGLRGNETRTRDFANSLVTGFESNDFEL